MVAALASSPAMPVLLVILTVVACVVAGLAFILFVVIPLAVLLFHRQSAAPGVVPHDPSPYPTPADEYFNELGPRLADLGFSETQRWTIQGLATNVAAETCAMADRRRRIVALATVVHVRRKGTFRLHSRYMEYSSRASDGRMLVTTNTPTAMLFTELGPRRLYPLPSVLDPAVLLQVHEKLVARDWQGTPAAEPGRKEDFPAQVRETLDASYAWQTARGLLRPLSGGSHRLTCKGAFLFTWAAMPPGMFVVRRRIRAAEKRLLRELGIAGA